MLSESQGTVCYADVKVWGKIKLPEEEYPTFTLYNAPLFEKSTRPAAPPECEDTNLQSWKKYLGKKVEKLDKTRKTVIFAFAQLLTFITRNLLLEIRLGTRLYLDFPKI